MLKEKTTNDPAELFGEKAADLMKPYIEEARKEIPDWDYLSITAKRLILSDELEWVLLKLDLIEDGELIYNEDGELVYNKERMV